MDYVKIHSCMWTHPWTSRIEMGSYAFASAMEGRPHRRLPILYNQDSGSTSLTIEAPTHQPSPLINLFPPPVLNTSAPYHPEEGAFYQQTQPIFPALDARPRLGSSTISSGMAHRTSAIPHAQQISARDQYSPATPSFRRPSEHSSRSPSFPGAASRRHPLSPTPSPIAGFTTPVAMDTSYSTKSQATATIPPLETIATLGILQYADGGQGTHVRPEIHGTIDKGFFLSDGEWTCYRRNYFSCVCSYTLSPHYPSMPLQFTPTNSQQTYQVSGFAMSISAVVADNDGHSIDLVQHTPKRDKGPIAKPDKVRLSPKSPQPSHHPMSLYTGHGDSSLGTRSLYDPGYGGPAGTSQSTGTFQTEHTFERIQFKQATANNGKRRAAQQYYHLVVELWADVGSRASEQFLRVAYRRSAKMIVRGRSPGHYQTERRGSTSSGPGGGSGSLSGYGNGPIMGSEFSSGGPMISSGFPGNYDNRGHTMPPYGARHHQQEILAEAVIPPEDAKAIETTKGYQYYPGTIYEGQQDQRGGVETFTHQRADHDSASVDPKHKSEYDGSNSPLPSLFHPGPLMVNRRCGRFEGKSRSEGYYPSMMPQSGINVANIT
ncbi:hypothetical protein jhhlp_005897 [Lomentospora prolificans]|uniref:NDT80 domain-containing protein n=1 Tax=Lomentospora prolificans TaxID=41688 RepID=A0A2N3N4D5_9PEZI|nr:hypothetical protein jhhlp_005897 [Lomentospora prolificans]